MGGFFCSLLVMQVVLLDRNSWMHFFGAVFLGGSALLLFFFKRHFVSEDVFVLDFVT